MFLIVLNYFPLYLFNYLFNIFFVNLLPYMMHLHISYGLVLKIVALQLSQAVLKDNIEYINCL